MRHLARRLPCDVHKRTVVACLLTPDGKEVRPFGTTTRELLDLSDWLTSQGCTHVAMESTGVFWKPVYNLLEDSGMTLLVVNARHIKAITTDYSHWQHGSFGLDR
jgi:transposase